MKNLFKFIFLLLMVSACREDLVVEDTIIDQPIPTNTYIYEFGFFGLVVDEDGNKIDMASVNVNGAIQLSDVNGYFEFIDQEASQNGVYVSAQKPGYVDGGVLVVPNQENTQQIRIVLIKDNSTSIINNSEGGILQLQNGSEVILPPDAFDIVTGVNVNAHFIPSTKKDFSEVYPSGFVGIDKDKGVKYLKSIGALIVKFTDDNGIELQIREGVEVKLRLPIPSDAYDWPETISLWSLDEMTGYWQEESTAVKVGEFYEGMVSHFSWWSASEPDEAVDVCFTVKTQSGELVPNIEVLIFSWYSGLIHGGYTDSQGGYCDKLPEGDENILLVLNECGISLFEGTYAANVDETEKEIIISTLPAEATFEGSISKCDGSLIQDGYLSFDFGAERVLVQIQDGNYSFQSYCSFDNDRLVEVLAVDKSDFSSSTVTINIESDKTNYLQDISLCETLETFMNYRNITSDKEVIFTSCEAFKNPVETLIIGKDSPNPADNVLLGVEGFTTGEFGTNLIGLVTETALPATFKTNFTSYEEIGGYIEGSFEGVTDNGDTIEGRFRALRIK